jgi:integrase/recombinase XerC
MRLAEKKDPDSGEVYVTRLPKYVWHCLRHTFAKLRYKGLQAAGNHSPWLELSKELGHKDIKTTMNTYLTVLDDDRRAVNAKTFAATRMLHGD